MQKNISFKRYLFILPFGRYFAHKYQWCQIYYALFNIYVVIMMAELIKRMRGTGIVMRNRFLLTEREFCATF